MTEVAGPSEFYFIVDGPLVTNGPPWNCVTADTSCAALEGNFGGTIELVDDCIVVQGADSPPGSKAVVIFRFGVIWDDSTSTIVGLGPEPVALGEFVNRLAIASGPPEAWTQQSELPDVPEKTLECMSKVGTDRVSYNTPWIQIGDVPIANVPDSMSAPPPSLP